MPTDVDNAAPPVTSVEDDVPCKECGYDLRGLTPPGRCPECGHDLEKSLQAHALDLRRRFPPDPSWARQVREGAWLGIAVFALLLLAGLAPEQWYYLRYSNVPPWETPGRFAFLSIAATWWALAWASAWKLTVREHVPRDVAGVMLWAIAARWLACLYLLTPMAWELRPRAFPFLTSSELVEFLVYFGLAGGSALSIRVGQLLWRRGARVAGVEACVLALGTPASLYYALSVGNWGPDSLSMMFVLPVYPYSYPVVFQAVIEWLPELRYIGINTRRSSLVLIYAGLPLWNLSLLIRVIVAYRPSALRPAAGPGRRSEPSSPP